MITNPSRRRFLRSLLALPIATTLDVEKLLWVPGGLVPVAGLSIADLLRADMERAVWEIRHILAVAVYESRLTTRIVSVEPSVFTGPAITCPIHYGD